MVVQSLLPGTPPSLSAMAQELSTLVSTSVPELAAETQDPSMGLQENCPACGARVPLEDITSAVCPNGHTWCSSSSPNILESIYQLINCFMLAFDTGLSATNSHASSMLHHLVHTVDAHGPDVYRLHPQSIPPTLDPLWASRSCHLRSNTLVARRCKGLGGRRVVESCSSMPVLWQSIRERDLGRSLGLAQVQRLTRRSTA